MSKSQDNTKQPPQSVKIIMRFFDLGGDGKTLQCIDELTLVSSELPLNHTLGAVIYKNRYISREGDNSALIAIYTPRVLPMRPVQCGRIIDKCSRCRIKCKGPRSLPVANPLDAWCDFCYCISPLKFRWPMKSRAKKKKIEARQAERREAIAAQRAQKLAKQEAAKTAAKNSNTKPAKAQTKKAVAGGDVPLHYEFAGVRDQLIYEEGSPD